MSSDTSSVAGPPELAQLPGILALMSDRIALLEARTAHLYSMSAAALSRQTVDLDDGFVGIRTPQGWVVIGQEEFRSVLYLADGQFFHEPGTAEVIRLLIQRGDRVVDIGAHIGLLSLVMAEAVGPEGHVYVFEPVARSAEAARRSLIANGFTDRCSIEVVAIAAEAGQSRFYRGHNSMMGSLYDLAEGADYSIVETRTLEQSLDPSVPISLIKIDVEGAEVIVLSGMQRIVADNDDILVIAEFGPSHLKRIPISADVWLQSFTDLGLTEIHVIDELSRTVRLLDRAELEQVTSTNLLFSKPGNSRLPSLPGSDDQAAASAVADVAQPQMKQGNPES